MSLKDVAFPLLAFFAGSLAAREGSLEAWNRLFLPFVLYGLLQEAAFFTDTLDTLLPWDAEHIEVQIDNGVGNLYQDWLLRFFGPMNAFWEFQVLVTIVPFWLLANRDRVENRLLLALNLVASVAVIGLMLERTPVLTAVLAMALPVLLRKGQLRLKTFAIGSVITLVIAAAAIFMLRASDEIPGLDDAVDRFVNMVTLQVSQDESMAIRFVSWLQAFEAFLSSPWIGIGPDTVLPGTELTAAAHFVPESAYLFFLAAYGIVGMAIVSLICVALVARVWPPMRISRPHAFIAGLFVIYAMLGVFHNPLLGKLGVFLLFATGFTLMRGAQADPAHERELVAQIA
jgi:O-antigen ligase